LNQHFGSYLCKKRHQHFQQPTTRVSWVPLASARSAHVTSAPTNAHASSPGAMASEVPGVIPRARRAGSLRPCQAARGQLPEKRGPRPSGQVWQLVATPRQRPPLYNEGPQEDAVNCTSMQSTGHTEGSKRNRCAVCFRSIVCGNALGVVSTGGHHCFSKCEVFWE